MPRPKSDLKRYMLVLSPADIETLDRIAAAEGLLTESGEPNRSAAARHLIRAEGKRLGRRAAAAEKNSG